MNHKFQKPAFIFPGQGAQYPGMGRDFYDSFPVARQTFEEADDILGKSLSKLIFNGPETELTETKNSQTAIYIVSVAMLRVVHQLYPQLKPKVCSGLSLGEYTALHACGRISFTEGLKLVQKRGQFMNEACELNHGTMAVVLGLKADQVQAMVDELALPQDLWTANFNCPGQIVISGTARGIEAGSASAKARGAKRVLPLQVHGAFHSGLMMPAEIRLNEYVENAPIVDSEIELVMNVPGDFVQGVEKVKENLIKQVTHSVKWEQGVMQMSRAGVDLLFEIGCKKTLTEFNKRMPFDVPVATLNVATVEDLAHIERELK